MTSYDVEAVRKDFPILERTLAGDHPLVYLDSANTSHKPRQVVEAIEQHYLQHNANVARAMHQLQSIQYVLPVVAFRPQWLAPTLDQYLQYGPRY